jgi:hypothetical protein
MIPREILKKIRQIEIRTNRIVTEALAGFSLQPSSQFGGVARAVKNCNDGKDVIFEGEINAVSLESFQMDFAGTATNLAKNLRLNEGAFQRLINFPGEFLSQTGGFIFIPRYGLKEFLLCGRLENELKTLSQPKRCRISAFTCSQGIPSPGFFSNSASRRSSSAINSGDSSGARSSKRTSAISRRSSGRNLRALAKISVALMLRSLPQIRTAGKLAFAGRNLQFPP